MMLASFDADPIGSLTAALQVVLDRPGATWQQLIEAAPFSDIRTAALLLGDERALDDLATELNELRDVPSRVPSD